MGTQDTIVSTNLPSFPWGVGDKLDAVPLNNAFIALQNQIVSLSKALDLVQFTSSGGSSFGVSLTMSWGGGNATTAGTYILTGSAAYPFALGTLFYAVGDNGGSFVASVEINRVPVPGLSGIVVSQSKTLSVTTDFLNGRNFIEAGDQIEIVISTLIGHPMNGFLTLNSTTPQVLPIFEIGTAQANGIAAIVGLSANRAIGVVSAAGAAQATGRAVLLPRGTSIFQTTAGATGVFVGASGSTNAIFIMGDPISGVLNVNPLG